MAVQTGITHYAWPRGLAMVIGAPASGAAAVFGPGGWRVGPAHAVFAEGPPPNAEAFHLALPDAIADQLASLQIVGADLHTDFVHLDRLVARLRSERADAAVFVVGRVPAALVLAGGDLTVIEPPPAAHEPADEVLKGADGWIVVTLGKVMLPAAASASPDAPAHAQVAPGPPAAVPPDAHGPTAAPAPTGAFGRFGPDARYVLTPGVANRLPGEATAQLSAAAGQAWPGLAALLDGAHTLSEIAAATGLGPAEVTAVVETLVAHRLVFRYVSRVRPPTGASTPG